MGDQRIPYESLRREIAAALSWPIELVTVDGAPVLHGGMPNFDSEMRGIVEINTVRKKNIGTGRDEINTYEGPEGSEERVVFQKGYRAIGLEVRIESHNAAVDANDLAEDIEEHLNGEGIRRALLNPPEGVDDPGISILDMNQITDVDFELDNNQYTCALLEVDAVVGYYRRDRSASKEWFSTVETSGEIADED